MTEKLYRSSQSSYLATPQKTSEAHFDTLIETNNDSWTPRPAKTPGVNFIAIAYESFGALADLP
jgi:hypothetical protein